MLFLITCLDRAGGAPIRAEHYPAHRAWLATQPADIKLSGPILGPDEESRIGSVFVVHAPDRAAAEAFSAADPFARAGLFASVSIHRFLDITGGTPAFGKPTP
jgi:uncharacterized protein YciI